jgi:hypothetical protein
VDLTADAFRSAPHPAAHRAEFGLTA